MYGWLLPGKAIVIFWRLVGCGHVCGVQVAAFEPRALMKVRVDPGRNQWPALKRRFGPSGVS
jgi:hypothetical protein